jgi:hypothetical protein
MPPDDVPSAPLEPAPCLADGPLDGAGARALDDPATIVVPANGKARTYPSLYDAPDTALVAIGLGLLIVVGLQLLVVRMFRTARTDHGYLTWFATTLVACAIGVYVADMLIAGPDTELLAGQERLAILDFIQSICLMVFSYYFGLKAQVPDPNTPLSSDANVPPAA